MKALLLMAAALLLVCIDASAASVVHSYNDKGGSNGIVGITGISQESSWECKNDTSILCRCTSTLFFGKIKKVDRPKKDMAGGFVLDTGRSTEDIVLPINWNADLDAKDKSWVSRLLRRGERVMVIAELCGASGRNVVARDIYTESFVRSRGLK